MTSVDRRRAHLRVGAVATGVFLLLLLLGAVRPAADASLGGAAATSTPAPSVQPAAPPSQSRPYGGHRGFEDRDRDGDGDGDRGFGGPGDGFNGGPPSGGAPSAPSAGAGSQT